MPPDAFLAVLAAALLHATWNARMKRGTGDPMVNACLLAFGGLVLGPPLLLVTGLPAPESWGYVLASAAVHVPYFLLVGTIYRLADYSVAYPLMRGGAPLVTALFGAALLNEVPSAPAWLGIAFLCLGVMALSGAALRKGGLEKRGILAIATMIAVIVAYTLIDGLGARASNNPPAYVVAGLMLGGLFTMPFAFALRGRAMASGIRTHWRLGIEAALMAVIGYSIALWAMTRMPIGVVAALRETSVLFAALIARVAIGERLGTARLLAIAAILAGLAAIQLG